MSDFLARVRTTTEARIDSAKRLTPPSRLREEILDVPRGFAQRIMLQNQTRIIAEVKRRSPSQGAIALSLDPVAVARDYANAGAAAISVLTEPDFFGGCVDDLKAIRLALPEMPLLMKDFVIDDYQILQAKAAGADAVLLIHSLLGETRLQELLSAAEKLNIEALVEVHDVSEMKSAIRAGAKLIGVNNRNLSTLNVSLEVSKELASHQSSDVVLVSESGIENDKQIRELTDDGFDAFLIGSALMKTQTPGAALAQLLRATR